MKRYIGTKQINAKPMTRQEYNDFRGWEIPTDENGDDEGYLVEYLDGGKPNTTEYAGYVSWSPKDVFEGAYQASGEMSFGHAVELLKNGQCVARNGWNGKGMLLFLVSGSVVSEAITKHYGDPDVEIIPVQNAIYMRTAQGTLVPWLCSQSDALAEDWVVI